MDAHAPDTRTLGARAYFHKRVETSASASTRSEAGSASSTDDEEFNVGISEYPVTLHVKNTFLEFQTSHLSPLDDIMSRRRSRSDPCGAAFEVVGCRVEPSSYCSGELGVGAEAPGSELAVADARNAEKAAIAQPWLLPPPPAGPAPLFLRAQPVAAGFVLPPPPVSPPRWADATRAAFPRPPYLVPGLQSPSRWAPPAPPLATPPASQSAPLLATPPASPVAVLRIADMMRQQPRVRDLVLPSAGSAGHHGGRCKPCAFVWKEGGCANGVECIFCHLCDPCERRNRKKERKSAVQSGEKRRGVAQKPAQRATRSGA